MPVPLESWSMGGDFSMSMMVESDSSETVLTAPDKNPELQHYNWNANMTNGDCGYCHAAPDAFLPANYKDDPGFCATCHNSGELGHGKSLYGYSHSLFVNATASGRRRPSYGNITAGEYNNQPFSRLKDGNQVVCITCHNVMQKPEDVGRTLELTTTSDNRTYTMQYGGWSASGNLVPTVYRDTSLWAGPTYSKSKKYYLVDPSEYTYNETDGTITFNTAQSANVYIYVSLDYPYLRASSQDNRLCGDCHTQPTHKGNNCLVCHRAHNTGNLAGIREKVRLPNLSSSTVRFIAYTGAGSFADGDASHDGICEVCHTQTKYYRRDGSGFANHSGGFNYNGTNCTVCHNHLAGFAGLGQLAVQIIPPFANNSTSETSALITGAISGRDGAEVGVTVNGQLAQVNGSAFAVAGLPLAEGVNTITAVATDTYGITASGTINVTVVNQLTPQVSLSASPSSGPAPLDVSFTVDSNVANAVSFKIDYGDSSNETADTLGALQQSYSQHTYSGNGIYKPTFTVTDGDGKVYSKNVVVNVSQPPNLGDKWSAMKAALQAGNISGAANYFSTQTRDSYSQQFQDLKNAGLLSEAAAGMGDLAIDKTMGKCAFWHMNVTIDGVDYSYFVLFVQDDDGIWRIQSF